MKVVLTGGTGFIGSHVLAELQEHGHEVTALVRNEADAESSPPAAPRRPWSTSTTGRRSWSCCGGRTAPSTLPAPVTTPAPTWIPPWSMRRSRPSPAPASPTSTSVVCGSTGPTPRSPRSPRSMRRRWWPGRSRSNAACSTRATCAESSSPPASRTATAAEAFPGCCSAHPETTPAT